MTRARYALVTGASMGLGKVFARTLAERKQNLVLVARSGDKLAALANELKAAHGSLAEPLAADLSVAGAGQQVARQLRERELSIDLLVNNAGFGLRVGFRKLERDDQLELVCLQHSVVLELLDV